MKINDLTLQMVMEFFFKAAKATYAGGAKPENCPEEPGCKKFSYQEGDLLYEDVYTQTNKKQFHGTTKISLIQRGKPKLIWIMYYWAIDESGGDKEQDAFLKTALMAAYNNNHFYGGRGKDHFYNDTAGRTLHYKNRLNPDIDERYGFKRFAGNEIISQSCSIIFQFNYVGGLVEDLKE